MPQSDFMMKSEVKLEAPSNSINERGMKSPGNLLPPPNGIILQGIFICKVDDEIGIWFAAQGEAIGCVSAQDRFAIWPYSVSWPYDSELGVTDAEPEFCSLNMFFS